MATLTKGKTFTNGELVTPANLHQMVDSATVANIVNADIAANAAIADTKLATISTANKVAQSAVTNLTTDLAGKAPASGIAPSAISGRFNNFIFGFLNEAGFGGFETTSAIGTIIVSDAGRNSVPEAILARWQRTNGSGVTSTIGTITTTGSGASTTGVAYNTTSDYRLKTNIEPLTDALSRLRQIPAHRFNWIADENGPKVDGFLAHEAQAVVPESVTGTKDAVDSDGKPIYQGIDQSKLVPLLVAAVQELAARVAALEAK